MREAGGVGDADSVLVGCAELSDAIEAFAADIVSSTWTVFGLLEQAAKEITTSEVKNYQELLESLWKKIFCLLDQDGKKLLIEYEEAFTKEISEISMRSYLKGVEDCGKLLKYLNGLSTEIL